jgi:hypothetical protein
MPDAGNLDALAARECREVVALDRKLCIGSLLSKAKGRVDALAEQTGQRRLTCHF